MTAAITGSLNAHKRYLYNDDKPPQKQRFLMSVMKFDDNDVEDFELPNNKAHDLHRNCTADTF